MSNYPDIYQAVQPVVNKTYGSSSFIDALIGDVCKTIMNYDPTDFRDSRYGREGVIMRRLWNWMAGGDTAAAAAAKIEHNLKERGV